MINLKNALLAWETPEFEYILKQEIERIDSAMLPLQQALSLGSMICNEKFSAILINVVDDSEWIHVKVGIFFTSVIAGCSCADDPSPDNQCNEYCELIFDINKMTAESQVRLHQQ